MRLLTHCTVAFVFSALLATAAHAQPIDGSTKESFERSVKAMSEGLSAEDREIFGKGLMNMIITNYPAAVGLEGFALISVIPAATEAAHINLNGVTKEEILERGRSLAAAQEAGATAESTAQEGASSILSCLQEHVQLNNAATEKGQFGYEISVSVTNGLPFALSGVRFGYRITTEGRSVPWLDDAASMAVPGGIEPGESKTLRTNLYSMPADAIEPLTTSVTLLDVADAAEHLLVGDVQVMGWAEGPSSETCP